MKRTHFFACLTIFIIGLFFVGATSVVAFQYFNWASAFILVFASVFTLLAYQVMMFEYQERKKQREYRKEIESYWKAQIEILEEQELDKYACYPEDFNLN